MTLHYCCRNAICCQWSCIMLLCSFTTILIRRL